MADHPDKSDIPAMLAAAAGLTIIMRQAIETLHEGNFAMGREAMNAMHEQLAVVGGSILTVADVLGYGDSVNALVGEGQARIQAAYACRGIEGRA